MARPPNAYPSNYPPNTRLIQSLKNSQTAVVEKLLETSNDINAVNSKGETSLMIASRMGDEKLIAHGAQINIAGPGGATALLIAAMQGHEKVVDELLKHHPVIDATDANQYTALMFAVQSNCPGIVD